MIKTNEISDWQELIVMSALCANSPRKARMAGLGKPPDKTRNHIPKGLPVALLAAFLTATSALHADSTQNKLPFPMPEFMSQSQVVAWQKDRIAKADAAQAAQAASSRPSTIDSLTAFYTGKPYLAESGSYAFKYREYNPEMNRWTTVDPSGFPDGANNRVYVNNSVLTHIDNNGCQIADLNFSGDVLTAVVDWNIAETYAQLADPLTYTAMTKAESSGSSWINDSSLNTTVKNSSLFTGTVTSGVSGWLHSNVSGNGNMGVNMTGLHNDGSSPGAYYFPAGDLSTALHGVLFSITGSVSGYGTTSGWQYGATVSYSKEYTFENHYQDVNPSLVNWIGVTLQKANLIFPFPIAGSFASKWIE